MACGDWNTKFFHGVATQRKRRSFIKGIRDPYGVWVLDEKEVGAIFVDFYTQLFSSSNPTDLERILEGVQPVVSNSMNEALTCLYSREEVEVVIKQMAPLKALGPDGMPPVFYQTFWPDIGVKVSDTILSCLNSSTLLKSINHTFITSIPKVNNPESVAQFRLINLCNVIYKILSKVIVNRLKPILKSIIFETQSAFVADRLITDNILITFESLYLMKTQCSGKTSFMALKLDMSKAYDKVEWVFLEKILLKMGFQDTWVDMIMQCIMTVSYSILVNGQPTGLIYPSRGLRQGDPLSPFLFLFCAKGLNALLCQAANNKEIRGYFICRVDILFVEQVQILLISSLPMIVCYFVEQLLLNVLKFNPFLLGMGLLLVSK